MNPAIAWLISQLILQTITRLQQSGKYDSLTQEEAELEVARITAQLRTELPSPADLIKQGEDSA